MRGWLVAVLLAVVAALAGVAGYWLHQPAPLTLPKIRAVTFSDRDSDPAASFDGSKIAFVSRRDGTARIWILEAGIERPLTEGEDSHPRFSPDGRHILYAHQSGIYTIGLDGGEPHLVLNGGVEGDWSRSGRVVAIRRKPGTAVWLVEVAEAGVITEFETIEISGPRWSPDGRRIAMRRKVTASAEPESIVIMDSDGTHRTTIPSAPGGYAVSAPAWINNDELVYVQSLSPSRTAALSRLVHFRITTGAATTMFSTPRVTRTVDVLPNGRFVLDSGTPRQNLREWTVESERWLTRGDSIDREPTYSPEGPWILFSSDRGGGLSGLWEASTQNLSLRPVQPDAVSPFFAHRGGTLFWTSTRSGTREIWSNDGQLTHAGDNPESPAISRDGTHIFYQNFTGFHRINSDGSEHVVLHPDLCFYPDISPNGKYIACAYGTFIQFLNAGDGKLLPVKIEDAARPKWMPDGRSVAFIGNNGKMESSILTQPFDAARDTNAQRRPLATFDLNPETFAIAPDGGSLVVSLLDPVSNLIVIDK